MRKYGQHSVELLVELNTEIEQERMATKKARAPRTKAVVPQSSLVSHKISALLHTMHCIAQHEDELCSLLHATKRANLVDAGLSDELLALLEAMPSREYRDDLEELREALHLNTRTPKRRSTPKKRLPVKQTSSSR